jgi:hypothetical protein
MFLTKCKMAGLSALTAGVLVAGAFGLSAQAPTPKRAADADGDIYFVRVSRAERIAELAREAQRRQEAGDAEGAARALRQIEDAAHEWRERLRQGDVGTRERGQVEDPQRRLEALTRERERARAALTDADRDIATLRDRAVAAERALEAARARVGRPGAANLFNPSEPGPDVETRLRDVERKIDRILQALEARPVRPPEPKREQPGGGLPK